MSQMKMVSSMVYNLADLTRLVTAEEVALLGLADALRQAANMVQRYDLKEMPRSIEVERDVRMSENGEMLKINLIFR